MANGVLDREDRDVEEEQMRQPSTATIQKGVCHEIVFGSLENGRYCDDNLGISSVCYGRVRDGGRPKQRSETVVQNAGV
jgi:hypothetical protein